MSDVIPVILAAVGIYAAIGVVFGVAFVAKGVDRIDPNAKGAGVGFRLLILPGSAAFWPLLLRRWMTGAQPPTERNARRDATGGANR